MKIDLNNGQSKSLFRIGLQFGFGFCIPFVVLAAVAGGISTLVQQTLLEKYKSDLFGAGWGSSYGPDAKLLISQHNSKKSQDNLEIFGKVVNDGDQNWNFIKIQAAVFDSNQEIVEICSELISSTLYPGDETFFEINCNRDEHNPMPNFDKYEIQIVNASLKKETGT